MSDDVVAVSRTLPWDQAPCQCVKEHTPKPLRSHRHHIWPLGDGGPDTPENVVPMCPSGHDNVHHLIDILKRYDGNPPGELTRRYNPYIRRLAVRGYRLGAGLETL